MGREDGGVDEVGEEEMRQGEHSPQHLLGKPGEQLLAPGISPLLLVPDDVDAGGDFLLEQWQSQAMVETNQMKLRKGHPARPCLELVSHGGEGQGR